VKTNFKEYFELYKLDPKPEDLIVKRLNIKKNRRAEPVFVA